MGSNDATMLLLFYLLKTKLVLTKKNIWFITYDSSHQTVSLLHVTEDTIARSSSAMLHREEVSSPKTINIKQYLSTRHMFIDKDISKTDEILHDECHLKQRK
jgi:hypothetical protein